jgi:hypothetical protein
MCLSESSIKLFIARQNPRLIGRGFVSYIHISCAYGGFPQYIFKLNPTRFDKDFHYVFKGFLLGVRIMITDYQLIFFGYGCTSLFCLEYVYACPCWICLTFYLVPIHATASCFSNHSLGRGDARAIFKPSSILWSSVQRALS